MNQRPSLNLRRSLPSLPVFASLLLAPALAALVVGCGPDPRQQQRGQSRLPDNRTGRPYQTAQKPQPRDEFERSGDRPINADTYFAAGQLAETQDAATKAEESYLHALKLNGDHKGSLFRLGVLYAKQKRYPEAIDAWNRYVRATGGEATGYANLGFALELAGRSDEAESAYLKGIKRDPMNAPCRVNFGLMLARHGKFSEATLEMQSVLSEVRGPLQPRQRLRTPRPPRAGQGRVPQGAGREPADEGGGGEAGTAELNRTAEERKCLTRPAVSGAARRSVPRF